MSWVTIVWSMIASACLTGAAIHSLVWFRSRTSWSLLFAVSAASTAVYAYFELSFMRAQSPAELDASIRWAQVPLFFWLVSLTWFVRSYLAAGRLWLAWAITVIRVLFLIPTFVLGLNPSFREVGMDHLSFLGESVTVVTGHPSSWSLVGQLTMVMLIGFVADASVVAWKRGDHRKALVVGGGVGFFLLSGLSGLVLLIWAGVQMPVINSVLNLGLIAVMGYELSRDLLRSSELVAELQLSDTRLRESEERMRLAVELAGLGIWTRQVDPDEVWATHTWRRIFGFTSTERLDTEVVLQRVHADDRDTLRQAHALAFQGRNGGTYDLEYRLTMPDGSIRWIASHGRVEHGANGGRPVLTGASLDITSRKTAEHETQMLREQLAHAGRVSIMGQLASALAHEINQPLAAILRNTEAAELYLNRPSPDLDEIRSILADIHRDDQRAGDVIDRMRRLLKRQTLDKKPLDMTELVSEVAALVSGDAAARRVKVELSLPGDLPRVTGDRVHLQQVVLNLMLNGIDAVCDGGRQDRRVVASAHANGGQALEITIGDSGGGILPEKLAKIFDPFFTTKTSGMGMGLPISRTIVEAHGGKIWAENQAGSGAMFHVLLPTARGGVSA